MCAAPPLVRHICVETVIVGSTIRNLDSRLPWLYWLLRSFIYILGFITAGLFALVYFAGTAARHELYYYI